MTSEKILEAAQKLFEDRGFDLTSVRDIATAADVNVALINYHFESKENLLLTILEKRMDKTRMRLSDINKSDLTPEEKLRQVVSLYVEKVFANCPYYHFVQRELSSNGRSELREAISKIITRNAREFRSLLEDGQKLKVFRKDADLELSAATLFGIIYQTSHEFFSKRYRLPGEKDQAFRIRVENYTYQLLISHLKK